MVKKSEMIKIHESKVIIILKILSKYERASQKNNRRRQNKKCYKNIFSASLRNKFPKMAEKRS